MTYIMVDIEADGAIPADYSMLSLGAVVVEPSLSRTFYAEMRPISEHYQAEALAVSGWTREQTLSFQEPLQAMLNFEKWILENSKGKPYFISDNNGFDWMFVCWYFQHFLRRNPFGHSSTNLGSLYKGMVKDTFQNFKHLRTRTHTHNALDDAIGNAEALLVMKKEMNLKIAL
ncbi:MAG: exonuclease [Cytophagales bacterium]|nr:MAG: exonuclease [Cytophagales bacterium]